MGPTEPVADRRRRAAVAGHRGHADVARDLLDDPEPTVRASALRALRRADALTPADLERSLADDSPEVRVAALELAATTAEPSIVPALDDRDHRVVEAACWSAGERTTSEPGVVARLATIAWSHPDPLCRESAIAALGAVGDEAGLAAILAALDDRPAVRRRAVVALAAFTGPAVDAALARARDDRDRQVRDAVEDLLGPAR